MSSASRARRARSKASTKSCRPTRLQEAAGRADFLINVLPCDRGQRSLLFDARVFAAMKPTAYYISAGRGQTVDEAALIAALRERRIAGAGLDVFQTEPLPPDSPFWDLPNVFITPHLGGYTSEYEDLIMPLIVDNMRAFLAGRQKRDAAIVVKRASEVTAPLPGFCSLTGVLTPAACRWRPELRRRDRASR